MCLFVLAFGFNLCLLPCCDEYSCIISVYSVLVKCVYMSAVELWDYHLVKSLYIFCYLLLFFFFFFSTNDW